MKLWSVLLSTALALGQGVAAKDGLEGTVTEEASVEKFPGEKLYLEKKKLDQGLENDISKQVDESVDKEKKAEDPGAPDAGQKTEKELEEEADKSPEEKLIDKHFDPVEKELNEHDR